MDSFRRNSQRKKQRSLILRCGRRSLIEREIKRNANSAWTCVSLGLGGRKFTENVYLRGTKWQETFFLGYVCVRFGNECMETCFYDGLSEWERKTCFLSYQFEGKCDFQRNFMSWKFIFGRFVNSRYKQNRF